MNLNIYDGLLKGLGISNLGNRLGLAAKSRSVIKRTSIVILCIIIYEIGEGVNDICPLISDYFGVKEKLQKDAKELMEEQIIKITDITSYSEIASVRASLNFIYSDLGKEGFEFSICKENGIIGLESLEEIERHIYDRMGYNIKNRESIGYGRLKDRNDRHENIANGLHYLLGLGEQERHYFSPSSKECYGEIFGLHLEEKGKILNSSHVEGELKTTYIMDRTQDNYCKKCHVDDVALIIKIDIEKKAKVIKEKILNILLYQIIEIIIFLSIIILIYYNIKGTKELEKAKDDAVLLAKNLETLLDTTPQGFLITLTDGKIIMVNQSLLQLLGFYSEDEMIGKEIIDFVRKEDEEIFNKSNHGNIVCELSLITKDGREVHVQIRGSILMGDNGKFTFCAFVTDLTQVMDFINAEINLIRTKENFLASVSHELRTPLNAIIGLVDLVLNSDLPHEEKEEHLKTVSKSSNLLLSIINDILDFSKISGGQVVLEQIPVNIFELLKDLEKMFDQKLFENDLYLKIKIQDGIQDFIGDPLRISQILINIIGNAIKFTEIGGVKVNCFLSESKKKGERKIIIEIEDTGIGMTIESMKNIFDDFKQADGSTLRKYGGTGLGLAICKKLIQAMSGAIYVESKSGEGSTFLVSIPFIPSEKESKKDDILKLPVPLSGKFETGRNIGNKPIGDIKILIVDDDRMNLITMRGILNGLDFGFSNITTESDGEKVTKMGDLLDDLDIILIDESMPGLSGSEVVKQIRSKNNKVVVISWSANGNSEHVEKVMEAGMDGYLVKPIDRENIIPYIEQFRPKE